MVDTSEDHAKGQFLVVLSCRWRENSSPKKPALFKLKQIKNETAYKEVFASNIRKISKT